MANEREIFLTQKDLERLEQLLPTMPETEYSLILDNELANAVVVPPEEIPPDVVTMNSRVRFEDVETGKESVVTLSYPSQADASAGRISILAPVGAALLGLSTGQIVEWPVPNSRKRSLRIKEVLYQPEAAGDYHL